MLQVEKLLQIVFALLCTLSGLILSVSQREPTLGAIAISSALLGLIFSDRLKWIRLRSWVANILSILVLVLAMKTFFNTDVGGGQLIAVANLLVYLQMVLLFQEKSPRLYWQLAVLSLLQVVVATIFNLKFEGGFFFIGYMLVGAFALTLLTIYHQGWLAKRNNRSLSRRMKAYAQSDQVIVPAASPLLIFDQRIKDGRIFRRIIRHLFGWLLVALVFSSILFYKIPRTDSAWFGPRFVPATATGVNKSLELGGNEEIKLSSKIVFRATFADPRTGQLMQLRQQPYFRGMALSSIEIKNGKTKFYAPYDRVYPSVYRRVPRWNSDLSHMRANVILEETADPLLYACMPVYRNEQTPRNFDFCHELSAISRIRGGKRIEMASLNYGFSIPTSTIGSLPPGFAYQPMTSAISARTMEGAPSQWNWLTEMDTERYPELVKLADQIADGTDDPESLLSVATGLADYFQSSREYQYTLDFTDIDWADDLDPIEDFTINHKTGHCSLYAASLCMMLRSQGIPARVVVGFFGGAFSNLNQVYTVTGQHAHAWVEAYIPPKDCSYELKQIVGVREHGCWLTLDATPQTPAEISTSQDTLNLARSLWDDYVLGLDSEDQSPGWLSSDSRVLGILDVSEWGNRLQDFLTRVLASQWLTGLFALIFFGLIIFVARNAVRRPQSKPFRVRQPSRIRKFFSRAVSIIAPNLGSWILRGSQKGEIVPFYESVVALLSKHGFERKPAQTHREFVAEVGEQIPSADAKAFLGMVTERFYRQRFGKENLSEAELSEVEKGFAELAECLKTA